MLLPYLEKNIVIKYQKQSSVLTLQNISTINALRDFIRPLESLF